MEANISWVLTVSSIAPSLRIRAAAFSSELNMQQQVVNLRRMATLRGLSIRKDRFGQRRALFSQFKASNEIIDQVNFLWDIGFGLHFKIRVH